MKFTIICLILSVAVPAFAVDFKLINQDSISQLLHENPDLFFDEDIPTDALKDALSSMVVDDDETSLIPSDSVKSLLTESVDKQTDASVVSPKGTCKASVTNKGYAKVSADCSRKGMIDSAKLNGTCGAAISGTCCSKKFQVNKDVKFDAQVVVVKLGKRKDSEIMSAAIEHGLVEEVNELMVLNGGKCPKIALVASKSCATETITSSGKTCNLKRKSEMALVVAEIPKVAFTVKGRQVQAIHGKKGEAQDGHVKIINKIDFSVIA